MIISDEAKQAIRTYVFDYPNTKVYEKYSKDYFDCIVLSIEDIKEAAKQFDLDGIGVAISFIKYSAWHFRANNIGGDKIYEELMKIYEQLQKEFYAMPRP